MHARDAFQNFYEQARHNPVFDEEQTVLLHLAAAMGVGCQPCMAHYLAEVKRLAICPDKVGAVQAIVMAVSAGRVSAQLKEAGLQPAGTDSATAAGDGVAASDGDDCPCT